MEEEKILIYEDKKWKLIDYNQSDMQYLNRYFGEKFSECIHLQVEKSDYLPYW